MNLKTVKLINNQFFSAMAEREQWGSRFGLILAMAGNAVGLGNFLRFPVQAASNGGGAFMIPYFISFILLAIPLMWVEWSIGRRGGRFGHGSLPGMFDVLWKSPVAKYIGVLGIFISTAIVIYYTYVESWCLGFSFFSLTGAYSDVDSLEGMATFLKNYQGIGSEYFSGISTAYIFLMITLAANLFVLWRGLKGGIEKFAKIAMPLLLIFAIGLVIWVFTVGTPHPETHPDWSVAKGFAYLWNPDFSQLSNPNIWLAAAGQIFFTVSVGMGTLQAYASYLRSKDDIALSGLATASINEFSEVILGSSIAIPVAVAFFGVLGTQAIAGGGSYNLGFVSMSVIFTQIPFGNIIGFIWFFLLFFAGITSSVAMAQPLISFLKEQFQITHKQATVIIGVVIFVFVNFIVFFLEYGFMDEFDYWAGTFGLTIVAFIQLILFAWVWGIDNGWKELNSGADIKVPKIFKYIIKYVTPLYMLAIIGFWALDEKGAISILMMKCSTGGGEIPTENIPYIWAARAIMVALFIGMAIMVGIAWKRNNPQYDFENNRRIR
jgi:SNF family Na+-dependent transporter